MYSKKKNEEGYGLVEFALVFPLLVVLLFFIMEFGWNAYQRHVFNSGYTYVSRNITATDLSYIGDIEDISTITTYNGAGVYALVEKKMLMGSVWGFDPASLSISNAVIEFKNVKEDYSVPGRDSTTTVMAAEYTRYMTVKAVLKYELKPITSFGSLFFGEKNSISRNLEIEKMIARQSRSE